MLTEARPTVPREVPTINHGGRTIRLAGHVALAFLGLAMLTWFANGWFSADEVVVRQQSAALAGTGQWVVPMAAAAVDLDPDNDFALLARTDRVDESIVPYAKHPVSALVFSGFRKTMGEFGLFLPGVLSALGAAMLVAAVLGGSRVGFWFILIGTPMLFHVTVLWAHAPGAFFAAISLFGLSRILAAQPDYFSGGALVVSGVLLASLFRSEGLLLGAALALALAVLAVEQRRLRPMAWKLLALSCAVFGVAVLTYLGEPILRESLVGGSAAPLGVPSRSGGGGILAGRTEVVRLMMIEPSLAGGLAGRLRLPGMLLLLGGALLAGRSGTRRSLPALLAGAGATLFALAVLSGPAPGFLIAMPLVAVALPAIRFRADLQRAAAILVATFAIAVFFTSYDGAGGGDWGARYLFMAVPFVAVLVVPALLRSWSGPARPVVLAGLVAGAAIQVGVLYGFVQRSQTVETVDSIVETLDAYDTSTTVVAVSDERLSRFLYDRGLRGASFHVPVDREPEFATLLAGSSVDTVVWVDLGEAGTERGGELRKTHGSVSIRTVVRR